MEKKYLFEVWTTEEYEGLPEGTHMNVQSDDGDNYIGLCSILATTFESTVPKNICTTKNPLEKLLGKIKLKATPEYYGDHI